MRCIRSLTSLGLIAVASCVMPGSSGDTGNIDTDKIYNGRLANKGEFPSVVAITEEVIEADGTARQFFLCTGTLITPRTVLSAAHCFTPPDPSKHYNVIFGSLDPAHERGLRREKASEIILHENFPTSDPELLDLSNGSLALDSDLALLILPTAINDIHLVPLSDNPLLAAPGNMVAHVGYGLGNTIPLTPASSGILRTATIPVSGCDALDDGDFDESRILCYAGLFGTIGDGDSGGPGFTYDDNSKLVQVSVGHLGSDASAQDVQLTTYLPWILRHRK